MQHKFYVYDKMGPVTVEGTEELVKLLMSRTTETDLRTFMERFAKRAQILEQEIDTKDVDSFVNSLILYGHVKKLEDDT